MTIEYLEWHDPEYEQLLTRCDSLKQSIKNVQEQFEEAKCVANYRHRSFELLKTASTTIQDPDLLKFFTLEYLNDIKALINHSERFVENQDLRIKNLMDQLSKANEIILNTTNGVKKLHIPSAKARLKNFFGIDPRSLAFNTDNKGPFMRWTSSGLKMCPDENHFGWIVAFDGMPVIPLQPIITKVYLHNSAVIMTHKRGQSGHCLYRFSGSKYQPHPHLMLHGKPCLGDFQGPLAEAVNELDVQTIVTIINLFLGRAITSDSAGRNWKRYFNAFLPPGRGNDDYFETRHDGMFKVIEREERGLYDIQKYDYNVNLVDTFPHPNNGVF